jgi:hypothetical protein
MGVAVYLAFEEWTDEKLSQDIVFIRLQALHRCRQEEIHRLPDFPAQWWSSQWQ